MKSFNLFPITALLISPLISLIPHVTLASDNKVSLQQVKADVSFLASDKLNGRANFSHGLTLAANYIAERFAKSGLEPLPELKSFKQTFNLYQFKNNTHELLLNNQPVAAKNSIVITHHESLKWSDVNQLSLTYISEKNDFRKVLRQINLHGKDSLIIVSKSHEKIFLRYRDYFLTQKKRQKNAGPSAVLVLSPEKKVKQLNVNIQSTITTHSLTNVVGVIPGKSKAREIVLFSAHYDHLGKTQASKQKNKLHAHVTNNSTPVTHDHIYNGADDDASGTTAVINLAQYYANLKNNERTLMFVAFAGEEIGGLGSRFFSEQIDADNIVAMLNIEMIGKPSRFGQGKIWMTGYERSNLAKILNKNLVNEQIHPDPYPDQNLFYRSDNATLARAGVAAHSFSSSQIDIDQHYHQVSDQVETLGLESMTRVINTIATAAISLVNGADLPNRIDKEKVKPRGKLF